MLSLSQHIAEKELVQILPKFKLKRTIELFSGEVGPFIPQSPATVPLWFAILLRKQQRCTIIIPEWLSSESLKELKRREKESPFNSFQPLHERYREIASLLLHHAPEDFEDSELVRSLIEDIENLRKHKIREGMQKNIVEDQSVTMLNLTDLATIEIGEIGPFLLRGLGTFDKLVTALHRSEDRQQDVTTNAGTQVIRKGGRKLTKFS
jgi:GINS complex subunit 2